MAAKEPKNQMFSSKNGESYDEEEEKWITHYSSNHQILLVGDGDFSFSLSLATAFTSAFNICASSLDSHDILVKKYKNAKSNLENLEKLGASLLHEVDATKMKHHTDLANRKFDRIIFNFPHAGFHGKENNAHMIQMHRKLVQGFFRNARGMLRANGEIHVNHKTTAPFCLWNLEELASRSSLALIQRVDFNMQDYPGYNNKRGDSPRCDQPFPLGESSTFKFSLYHRGNNLSNATSRRGSMHGEYRHFQTIPMPVQLQPASDFNYPQRTHFLNHIPLHTGLRPTIPNGSQYCRVLDRSLNSLVPTYERNSFGLDYPERLRSGFDATYYGLERVRNGLDRQTVEMSRTSNGNLFYKHENEQVRRSLDRQMLELPRTLNGSLYYKHEHEQVRHSLHGQMVDVPRTLNGSLYYMLDHENERMRPSLGIQMLEVPRTLNEHERVRHVLDGQTVEVPRPLNSYLYNMHEHDHDRVRHCLDRERAGVLRPLNSYLYNTHEHEHEHEHEHGRVRHCLDRERADVLRPLNSDLYNTHEHDHDRVRHCLDRERAEALRPLNSYLYNTHEHEHEHDRVRHCLDLERAEVPRPLNSYLYNTHGQLYGNEQVTHILDRPMVEVPRTLNGSSLYSMNDHRNAYA